MRSIVMMAYANIKKRKLQSFLIVLTILMTVVLLATSIGILGNLESPFEKVFESLSGSHVVMELDEKYHSKDEVISWWRDQSDIENVEDYRYKTISDKVIHNGETKSIGSYMITERKNKEYTIDKLEFVEGDKKASPDMGEIWIPTGYAYGWNINRGDTLVITMNETPVTYTVAAIVVDPQYSASMMNPVRLWVSEDTLENYFEQDDLTKHLIGIRFNDFASYNDLWQDFEAYLGTPFFGFVYDYSFIVYMFSFLQSIIAMIMLVFSIIILTVAVFVITFTIINGIIYDYKTIGVLKAQGFSGNNIKAVYSMQYLILSVIALPIGLAISSPLINMVMNQMTRSLGLSRLNQPLGFIIPVTVAIIIGIVLLATLLSARKAVKIKPVEAIRNNQGSLKKIKKGISIKSMKSLPVEIMLGIKSIFQNKRHSIFILVSALVLAFVMTFAVNIFNSVKNMDENYAFWGFDETHVFVSVDNKEQALGMQEMIDYLQEDERVHTAIAYGVIIDGAIAAQNGISSTNGIAFVYSGDMDGIGLVNIEGINPMGDNEISVSYLVAKKYNKKVGDEIDVFVAGVNRTLKISGIYQSLNAGGWGFKISDKIIKENNPDYELNSFSVRLNDRRNIESYINDFEANNEGVYSAKSVYESGEINIEGLTNSMAMVSLTLSLIFAIISVIIIFNFILIDINNNKKELGIYKAIGTKTRELRLAMLCKVFLLSIGGILLGLPLSLIGTPKLVGIFLIDMGLVKFPFDITILGTLFVIPVCLTVNLISVWLSTSKLKKLNLRELIVD